MYPAPLNTGRGPMLRKCYWWVSPWSSILPPLLLSSPPLIPFLNSVIPSPSERMTEGNRFPNKTRIISATINNCHRPGVPMKANRVKSMCGVMGTPQLHGERASPLGTSSNSLKCRQHKDFGGVGTLLILLAIRGKSNGSREDGARSLESASPQDSYGLQAPCSKLPATTDARFSTLFGRRLLQECPRDCSDSKPPSRGPIKRWCRPALRIRPRRCRQSNCHCLAGWQAR